MAGGELYYPRMSRLTAIVVFLLSAVAVAEETPAWLIRVPETTSTVYIAETSTSTFHRFVRDGGSFRLERQDYMSIGKGGDAPGLRAARSVLSKLN